MTSDALWSPTRVFSGTGIVESVLSAELRRKSVVLIFDPVLEGRVDAMRSIVNLQGELGVQRADLDSLREALSLAQSVNADVVIALGGGTVIDIAKLAGSMTVDFGRFDRFSRVVDRRGALATNRDWRGSGPQVIAIPSTIGTASEVSPIACITTDNGHRLIQGDDLRPQVAILDAVNYDSLPVAQVLAGAFEAFLRVAGPAVGMKLSALAMAASVDLASKILVALDALETEDSSSARLELARLSAETRLSWGAHVGAQYPVKHWYLANELAFYSSTPKMLATASLLAECWRRIESGDLRFGVRRSLLAFWNDVAQVARLDPAFPIAGIDALLTRFNLTCTYQLSAADEENISSRVIAAWGGRGQALQGWDRDLVAGVFKTAGANAGLRFEDGLRGGILIAHKENGGDERE